MTEAVNETVDLASVSDPTTEYFWQSACEHRLVIQACQRCGSFQFYPRPFCLSCNSTEVEWVESSGRGTIYSKTVVRVPVVDELVPPYVVALVELEEGPRLVTHLTTEDIEIGTPVEVTWAARDGLPPLPVFGVRAG